ncbi:tetratricopeptide repeat protein [bacterium]|nr:tetratricopeptide repeat protein [bacterium]
MPKRWIQLFGMICFGMGMIKAVFPQTGLSEVDSTFWSLSLPEIQNYRAYYVQELEMLQEEKRTLIQRGIEDGERLLQMRYDDNIVDEILVRLADLYYYQEKDDYLTRMQLYDEQLTLYEQGVIQEVPEEPQLNCQHSLEIYQRIIDEFPQSDLTDDAFYNKAFLLEELGRFKEANQVYVHLIDAYPGSQYVPEAYMRLGEYYFNPPMNDLTNAIYFYNQVLNFRDSPRYDEALYKLGWSYYRLSQYPEAISYFTTLVENQQMVQRIDPMSMELRADLIDEAIEYVSISFIDFGGVPKMMEYLNKINRPEWGAEALRKLGDIYMVEQEEYMHAVAAYEALLNYAPYSSEAPTIQKKIIDCYEMTNNQQDAILSRQQLFSKYRAEGEWWNQIEDEEAKLQAYGLAEQALRENINSLISMANEESSQSLYEEIVELGESYLESFPEDLHAYMIRWNNALILDTKLHAYKKALQEYLTISLVYNHVRYETFARERGLATIKDAAENAVVVADSLVRQEKRQNPELYQISDETDAKEPRPLTTAESWLAMAYDNYIKLFPFDKETPTVLANAGALYYTHNQFNEALKYFKTLVEYFPRSEQVHNVQFSILDSYFGKKDYISVENLAKRLLSDPAENQIKPNVERRLGEAIFLGAQELAEEGKGSLAADEYYRMALEVPSLDFADRSLFNAAREYERIGNYNAAIRAYELLRASYSGSSLLADAFNNVAFNYGEIGEYKIGAERYEMLYQLLKDGDRAKDALFNACIFYEKAQEREKLIEVSQMYATRYPDAEDAPNIFLKTAGYYLELGLYDSAVRVYADFPKYFPNSPLVVEAYSELGNYYFGINAYVEAEESYLKAYTTNDLLKKQGLEGNDYYAAEGLFLASRIQKNRFNQITFSLPQFSLNQSIQEKTNLLERLVSQYANVIAFGTYRFPESLYRIGEVYENFAQTWANQEIPPMDPTSQAIKEKEISSRTTQIYSQTLAAYRNAVDVLQEVMAETITPEKIEEDTFSLSSSNDSLLTLIHIWLSNAQDKVSETLYQMAEVNAQSVDYLLNAPIPSDLDDVAKLEYRSQVLVKAIRPLLQIVEEAHRRNILVADTLGIHNRWTEASRLKRVASLKFLSDQYQVLSFDALNGYHQNVLAYRERALVSGLRVPEELQVLMLHFIELSQLYSNTAIQFTEENVNKTSGNILEDFEITEIQDDLVEFVVHMVDSLEKDIEKRLEDQQEAESRFQEEGSLHYEEVLATFEDHVFFLEENKRIILESAYDMAERLETPSILKGWLGVRLVQYNPDTYADKLDIPIETFILQTDTSWRYSPTYQDGWEKPNFDMSHWYCSEASINYRSVDDIYDAVQNNQVMPAWLDDSLYVRKIVDVPGFPISMEMRFLSDQPDRVYLNGILIAENVDSEPFSLMSNLKTGENLIALACFDEITFPLIGVARIRYIPDSVVLPAGRK